MPIHETNGVRIHYVQLGDGATEPREDLVMVHGLGTSLAFWYSPHGVAFSERFRVTLVDLRGHGRSSMPARGYQPELLALDLQSVLNSLGIAKAHFVAHSFGGVVALSLARLDPDRFVDLVLADTQVSATRHERRPGEWKFGKSLQRLLDQNHIDVKVNDPFFGYHILDALARLDEQNKELSPELAGLLGPVSGKNARRSGRQWLELLSTTTAREEFMANDGLTAERLQALKFPILTIYGEHSNGLHCGEWLRSIWAHASFVTVPGAGHFFPSSRPLLFMDACHRFWRDTRAVDGVHAPEIRSDLVPPGDLPRVAGSGGL